MNVATGQNDDNDDKRSRRVIELAQKEAHRLGHNFVGTEQIFTALIENGGNLKPVFNKFGITIDWARGAVEEIIGRGSGFVAVEVPFTPRAKRVLELSWLEARDLGHNFIAPEHIMLALIREGEGVAGRILKDEGINTERLRKAILALFDEPK